MLKGIIAIFVVFSVSYWIGYLARMLENDYRPICFVAFLSNDDEAALIEEGAFYYGYYENPVSNIRENLISVKSKKGGKFYFFISKDGLIEEANGREIMLVITTARYSKRNDAKYLAKKFSKGSRLFLNESKINQLQ